MEFLKKADLDKNGQINYSEFIDIAIEKKALLQRKNLEVAFKTLDYNRDGKNSFLPTDFLSQLCYRNFDL